MARIRKDHFTDLALRVDRVHDRWSSAYFHLDIDSRQEPTVVLHIDGVSSATVAIRLFDWAYLMRFVFSSVIIFALSFVLVNASAYYQIIKTSLFGLPTIESQAVTAPVALVPEKPLPLIKNPALQKKQIPPLSLTVLPPDDRIIIPKIGRNVPIIHTSSANLLTPNWDVLQKELLQDLQRGVVHFPGTANPGERGNVFITGHSSYYPWDPGKFKDVFALLHRLELGDKIYIVHRQKRYVYEIAEQKVVAPSEIDVLKQTPDHRLTLMTCTPVGTNLRRLVLIAKLVEGF